MPNRILRDWTDSFAVNHLDADAERLFVRLIMKADDFGRFHAEPRLVKANCFPLKSEVRDTDISRWLAACQAAGMIRCYSDARGRKYLEIANFKQRTRATESKYPEPPPPPPGTTAVGGPMTVMCPSTDGRVTGTCQTPAHGDGGVFVCGDEVEAGGEREKVLTREALVAVVEEILAAYPRKDSPVECRRSVMEAINAGEAAPHVLKAVRACAVLIHAAPGGSGNRFVPSARTFFGESQWRSPEAFANRWSPAREKPATVATGTNRSSAASRDERGQRAGEIPTDVRVGKVKVYRLEEAAHE